MDHEKTAISAQVHMYSFGASRREIQIQARILLGQLQKNPTYFTNSSSLLNHWVNLSCLRSSWLHWLPLDGRRSFCVTLKVKSMLCRYDSLLFLTQNCRKAIQQQPGKSSNPPGGPIHSETQTPWSRCAQKSLLHDACHYRATRFFEFPARRHQMSTCVLGVLGL